MKTIAIIPAYNEKSTIGDVIKATSRFVDEILVISDGSTDSTIDVAKKAGATVIDNIVNRGLGRTIQRGYDEARRRYRCADRCGWAVRPGGDTKLI